MRSITMLIAILNLSGALLAAEQVMISPVNTKILAKIAKDEVRDKEIFVSFNGGNKFDQITWPNWPKDKNCTGGQALSCQWSSKGWLLIEFNNRGDKYDRTISIEPTSLGVFDPTSKIIYWIAGCQAKSGNKGIDESTPPKWIGPDTILYRTVHSKDDGYKGIEKKVTLSPSLLKNMNQDLEYYLSCFVNDMLKATRSKNYSTYLAKIYPKDRATIKKFCNRHQELVHKYYILNAVFSDKITYYKIDYTLTSDKANELLPKKDTKVFDIELNYNTGEPYYHVKLDQLDSEYGLY